MRAAQFLRQVLSEKGTLKVKMLFKDREEIYSKQKEQHMQRP